ncbi:MAG TPA: hypothetical protein VJO35_02725 [Terriglobales bacterium]|nr:hypothetical protein [Terriglobales bacterium]
MGLVLATFEGTFETEGPYGDGGYRMRFTVDKVVQLESTARASAHHDPPWAADELREVRRDSDRTRSFGRYRDV